MRRKCDDEYAAMSLCRNICRLIEETNVSRTLDKDTLLEIARKAELVARWARNEAR